LPHGRGSVRFAWVLGVGVGSGFAGAFRNGTGSIFGEIFEKNSCLFALSNQMTLSPFRLQGAGKETLRFPLPVPSRLAVVGAEFHLAAHMRAFECTDIRGLAGYAPDAMALPLDMALSLADRSLRGLFELPSLRLAIVVFSSAGS